MAEFVRDEFARTTGSGSPGALGTSPIGGPWSVAVSASLVGWSVDGQRGRADYAAGTGGTGNALLSTAVPAAEVHGSISFRANVDGIGTATAMWFRTLGTVSVFTGYGVRIFRPANGVGCTMELLRGANDAPVVIATSASFTWPTAYTSYITVELEVLGGSPSTVRGRWFPLSTPPADDSGWLQVTDSAGPQAAGAYGLRLSRSGAGNTVVGAVVVAQMYVADPLRPNYTVSFDDSGLLASFDSATLTTGDPVAHLWDFGDGTPVTTTTQNPTHIYAAAGTYSVTYTATTRWGTKRSFTNSVVVPGGTPLPIPPVKPDIFINGESICDRVFAANWFVGRDRWPDETTGTAVTLQVRGRLADVVMGAPLVIALPQGAPDGTKPLFTGEVDTVTESIEPVEGKTVTTIIAKDVLAFLGSYHILPSTNFPEHSLPFRVGTLAPRGTTIYKQKWAGVPAARWPLLKALTYTTDKLRGKYYLDLLKQGLRASLATAYTDPTGAVVYAPLDPPAGITPPTLDLGDTGFDCPEHEDYDRSTAEGIVNRWTAGDTVDIVQRTSIEAYGESEWAIETGILKTDSTFPITDPIVEQMREPFPARKVIIPIRDWSARSFLAQPLDIASRDGVLYGILGVAHDIGIDDWRVTLTLDRDPWTMTGATAPTPPPAVHTSTQTFDCTKDSLLASPNMGAGKSTRLPVGLWSGTKFRALIQFDLNWAHTPKKVTKAELLLDTAGQDACGYGSSPQMYIDRVTGSWNEGSSGGDGPPWTFNTSNAVVYPGPSVTSSGRVTANVTNSQNAAVTIAMTTICRAWADGSPNRGIRLMSTNEASTSKTIEFYSDEYSTTSRRPQLRVTYEW